jgi:hypothetical protein
MMQDIGDRRAGDAERIDAVMGIKAPVLDSDEGFRQIGRDFLQCDRRTAHVAARGEHPAV